MKDTSTHGLVNFFHTVGDYYCEFCVLDTNLRKLAGKPEYKNLYPLVQIKTLQDSREEIKIKIGENFKILRNGVILTEQTKIRWMIYKIKKIAQPQSDTD